MHQTDSLSDFGSSSQELEGPEEFFQSPSLRESSTAGLIAHPENLNRDTLYELRELVAKYPYFQAARLLYLQNIFLLHDRNFGEELRQTAACVPDRRVLFRMVEGRNYEIRPQNAHKEAPRVNSSGDRTETLIENFLRSEEKALFPDERGAAGRPISAADVATDYVSYLLQMEDAVPHEEEKSSAKEGKRRNRLIDDFIENSPEKIQLSEAPRFVPELPDEQDVPDADAEEGFLTMTLAKIYVKQQRYEKALEIMRKVNSSNPKKSAYFADQIRFLQKLIVNKNHEKA